MRTYYDIMGKSNEVASDNTNYPDPLVYDIANFKTTSNPEEYSLSAFDLLRPDLFIILKYGSAEYLDLVLEYNQIAYIKDKEVGDVIKLPTIYDLESFYLSNLK